MAPDLFRWKREAETAGEAAATETASAAAVPAGGGDDAPKGRGIGCTCYIPLQQTRETYSR